MRLGRVHAEPGFGQHMLAGLQGRERDRAVQVGPGADDDRVDGGIGDELFPGVVHARHVELARDGGR